MVASLSDAAAAAAAAIAAADTLETSDFFADAESTTNRAPQDAPTGALNDLNLLRRMAGAQSANEAMDMFLSSPAGVIFRNYWVLECEQKQLIGALMLYIGFTLVLSCESTKKLLVVMV